MLNTLLPSRHSSCAALLALFCALSTSQVSAQDTPPPDPEPTPEVEEEPSETPALDDGETPLVEETEEDEPATDRPPVTTPEADAIPERDESEAIDEEDLDDLDAMMDEIDAEEDDLLMEAEADVRTIEVSYTPEEIAKSGGSVQILDEDDLARFQNDDVTDVVTKAAGVYVREEDGFGLRPNIGIRGANSERSKKVNLMEDGVLFGPAPYSAPAAYYFPLMQRITGVEIFKGPGAIIFGPNPIGGSLNFTTRKIEYGHHGGLTLAGGSFPTGKVHVWHSYGNERFGVLGEAVHLRSAGFKDLDSGGPTGFDRTEAVLRAHVNSDPTASIYQKLTLQGIFSDETSNETYMGLTDEDFARSPYRRYRASALDQMNLWRLALRVDHGVEFGENLDLRTVVYRHDMSRAWKKFNNFGDGTSADGVLENPEGSVTGIYYRVLTGEEDSTGTNDALVIGTNARRFYSQGIQSTLRHRHEAKTWSNRVEAGVRLHQDQIQRDHSEELYAMTNGELVRTDDPETFPTRNTDQSTAFAIWALDQLSFWRLTLTPGVRYEHILTSREDRTTPDAGLQKNTQGILIPGAGTFLELGKGFGLLAGVHRGFSPVSPGQGDGIKPETSLNYEGGVRFDNLENTSVEAIGFFNDYRNLSGECTFAAGCAEQDLDDQFNAGRAWIYGAEFLVSQTFALGRPDRRLRANLSYTFTQTELLTSFESKNPQLADVEPGDELPYVPRHQGALTIGYEGPKLAANIGATYIDSMREEASQGDEGRRTDAYVMSEALVSYNVWRQLHVYGKGNNLLDAQPVASRRPFGARPISPRYLELGVRMRWGAHTEDEGLLDTEVDEMPELDAED